ncbi:MAG: 2,3-bisphosphoglycerate-independent phosphoglycerate mutase, partial [Candidatus Liptonbacteria bacterium]|nr:2,3-bisphosphoglycerate-independent phosphoglycerate mutase [Candidatus Liptonbacteria bacterium]
MARRSFILAVLDGWGIGKKDQGNPIHIQNPQNIEYVRRHYRTGSLQASGIAVGL